MQNLAKTHIFIENHCRTIETPTFSMEIIGFDGPESPTTPINKTRNKLQIQFQKAKQTINNHPQTRG